MIRNERGDLQADLTKIVDPWKSYFNKLLNVHNGEQTEEFKPFNDSPFLFSFIFKIAYSNAKLKSSCDKASPCLNPLRILKLSDILLPIRTLLMGSLRHIFTS